MNKFQAEKLKVLTMALEIDAAASSDIDESSFYDIEGIFAEFLTWYLLSDAGQRYQIVDALRQTADLISDDMPVIAE